jgi:hypothetical protein
MMSDEKCLSVLEFYQRFLEATGAEPVKPESTYKNCLTINIFQVVVDIVNTNPTSREYINEEYKYAFTLLELLMQLEHTEPLAMDYDTCFSTSRQSAMNHLSSMLPKMVEFASQGRDEKLMRWFGFIISTLNSFDFVYDDKETAYNNLLWVLPEMRQFIEKGNRLAFMLDLGIIQGALCSFGSFTLNELRDHNRSDDKPETP